MLPDSTVCFHHKKIFLDLYSTWQKNCCNPFDFHKAPVKKGLRIITLEQALQLNTMIGNNACKDGMKMCVQCRTHFYEYLNEAGNSGNGQSDMIEDEEIPQVDYADFVSEEHLHVQLDTSLTAIGISPLKLPKLHQHERHSYIKRKTEQIKKKSQQMLCDYAGLPSSSMNVPPDISRETVSEMTWSTLLMP